MKIYLQKAGSCSLSALRKKAGIRTILGLSRFRPFIDSISIHVDKRSGPMKTTYTTCRLLIKTVHGGVILVTSRGAREYLSLCRSVRKSRGILEEIFGQFVDSGQADRGIRGMVPLMPVEVSDVSSRQFLRRLSRPG